MFDFEDLSLEGGTLVLGPRGGTRALILVFGRSGVNVCVVKCAAE